MNDTTRPIGFPENPNHGDIFEYKTGLYYQYDGMYNSWIGLRSNKSNIETATTLKKGAMSSEDLQKLNRLVLPVPNSTLTSDTCNNVYKSGAIGIYGGDKFVGVDGQVDIRNIDEFGDSISEKYPFKIHQHTNGFDFTLDLESLVKELINRNQIVLKGKTGDPGAQGEQGDDGIDRVLAGPRGAKGPSGSAPACDLTIEEEVILNETKSDVTKAIVDVRVRVNGSDPTKYNLEFDRQEVGSENFSATRFEVKGGQSPWILAVSSIAAGPQPVYYFDVEPLLDAIKDKYEAELGVLKQQYENITAFWIQKMSDLFDEQKAALCCALEFCRSATKSNDLRQHMESVAAAAVPDAKIRINGRGSGEQVSSTTLLPRLPGGSDSCGQSAAALSLQVADSWQIEVDPITNMGSSTTASITELPAGRYTAIITEMLARKDGKYGLPIKIEYSNNGRKSISFLNKGQYDILNDARHAYEGLSLGFEHQGGDIRIYYPIMPSVDVAGKAQIVIRQTAKIEQEEVMLKLTEEKDQKQVEYVEELAEEYPDFILSADKIRWYSDSWKAGLCCGLVVNVGGQDYIVVKRSIGDNKSCGGGAVKDEFMNEAIDQLGEVPAIAWPTLDGKSFAPIANKPISFIFDQQICDQIQLAIERKYYSKAKGNPIGSRHLAYQLSLVLFPKL